MFKKGNVFNEQDRHGWIYGSFMPEGLQKDERIEIKVTTLPKTFTSALHYSKTGTRIEMIWKGEAIWEVNSEEVHMKSGDYVIIPPNIQVAVRKILSDEVIVQTIKVPSIPSDKVMVE